MALHSGIVVYATMKTKDKILRTNHHSILTKVIMHVEPLLLICASLLCLGVIKSK